MVQSLAVSTARFLFSSLEKYVIGIYICISETAWGAGRELKRVLALAESRACPTSACLSLVSMGFIRYVLKNKRISSCQH